MKKAFAKFWARFLIKFGNIKIYKFPMFIIYDPYEYAMDGEHMQKALDILKPGDVILRGYDHYMDGYFINDPLKYSHGAIYVGDNKIIHASATGVGYIHAIDFMKCDRVCIFRPAKHQQSAVNLAKKLAKDHIQYDFLYESGNNALYCYELVALCYKKMNIQKLEFKKFFGLLKRNAYLANSFRENENFTIVFEYNKKFKIDTERK